MGALSTIYDDAKDVLDPAHITSTATADTSALNTAAGNESGLQSSIADEAGNTKPSQVQMSQTRQQQQDQLAGLQAQANGTAPSAAGIAGSAGAASDAAKQFAMASAIRSRGAGAALGAGTAGLTAATGATGANAATARANEQAQGRGALIGATTGMRGQDETAYQTNQTNYDTNMAQQLAEQAIQNANANAIATANATAAGATNQKRASTMNAAGSLIGSLSDLRAKRDVREKDMADALGRGVHGVTFAYRPGLADGGKVPHFGLIADELEKVIPGVVNRSGPGGLKQVDTAPLTLANTALLAEMARRIKELEARR